MQPAGKSTNDGLRLAPLEANKVVTVFGGHSAVVEMDEAASGNVIGNQH